MRQIITLLILVFVFFGCVQKQTVPLKLPQTKEKVNEIKIKKEKPSTEVITPVIEGLKPIDIKVSDGSLDNSVQAIEEDNIQDNVIISEIQVDLAKVKIKVAFIYPSSVSKYARSSLNTISGYLSYQKADYNLLVIDCENESYDKISSAFSKVQQEGITNVVALFTPNAISTLNKVVSRISSLWRESRKKKKEELITLDESFFKGLTPAEIRSIKNVKDTLLTNSTEIDDIESIKRVLDSLKNLGRFIKLGSEAEWIESTSYQILNQLLSSSYQKFYLSIAHRC